MLGPNICGKGDSGGGGDSGGSDSGAMNEGGVDSGDSGATCIGQTIAWWQGETSPNDHFNMLNFASVGTQTYPNGEVGKAFGVGNGAYLKQSTRSRSAISASSRQPEPTGSAAFSSKLAACSTPHNVCMMQL